MLGYRGFCDQAERPKVFRIRTTILAVCPGISKVAKVANLQDLLNPLNAELTNGQTYSNNLLANYQRIL